MAREKCQGCGKEKDGATCHVNFTKPPLQGNKGTCSGIGKRVPSLAKVIETGIESDQEAVWDLNRKEKIDLPGHGTSEDKKIDP